MAETEEIVADENYVPEHEHEHEQEHEHEHEHEHEQQDETAQVIDVDKDQTNPLIQQDKVFIVEDTFENSTADCIVCSCGPGMDVGFGWFDELVESAGPQFEQELALYKNTTVGGAKILSSYNNKNFKAVVVMFVPEEFRSDVTPVESYRVRAFVRNALDIAAEAGMRSIIFPPTFNKTGVYWAAPILTRCFKEWCSESPYVFDFDEIRIVCIGRADYDGYVAAATRLTPKNSDSTLSRTKNRGKKQLTDDYYQEDDGENGIEPRSTGRRRRQTNVDPIPNEDIEQMRSNGMFLVLSAKLEPTILNLKDEHGKKRQYRMTNRSRDGRKLYFRCSRCDTLAKRDKDATTRARLILSNGQVSGDEFPSHHPDCEPWTDEQLLVQQIDRSSRKTVKEGLLQPFEAYQDALSRVTNAVATEAHGIDVPKFPEWSEVRQQTYRHRKKRAEEMEMHQEHMEVDEDQMHDVGVDEVYEGGDFLHGDQDTEIVIHDEE